MRPLVFASVLFAGVGCVHFQPIGPLAKQMGRDTPTRPAAGVKVMPPRDAAMMPVLPSAPPPTPPSLLVTPGEVSETNHPEAARRLVDEMDADRKSMDEMPRYSDVSVVKGGR